MDFLEDQKLVTLNLFVGVICSWLSALLTVLIAIREKFNRMWMKMAVCFLMPVSLFAATIDGMEELNRRIDGFQRALMDIGFGVGLAFAVFILCRFASRWSLAESGRSYRRLLVGVGTAALFICLVCVLRLQDLERRERSLRPFPLPPGRVESELSTLAVSDKGRKIMLYHYTITGDVNEYSRGLISAYQPFQKTLIKRANFSLESNCHGWIFTGGEYFVMGSDVKTILEDNDYVKVDSPQVNDIAVYYDVAGNISHTALVCACLQDGTILLESKWGIDERFIHLPSDQPYSKDFEFFRTHRGTHSIRIYCGEVDS